MEDARGDMENKKIEIMYENNDVLVINKPAGLAVHRASPKQGGGGSDGKREEETLAGWVATHYPDVKNVGEPLILQDGTVIDRPGIVHRLDRDTSGVLVIAKNARAFAHLKGQFQKRMVEKTYQAICYGVMKKDTDTIDRPIGRSASDFRKWSAQRGARGQLREAITQYEVITRGKGHTLVRVFPKTGRTHQIRVHFKAINYPVVCDKLYAPKQPCDLGLTRHALHAESISFTVPSGERVTVEAPPPADFASAVDCIDK